MVELMQFIGQWLVYGMAGMFLTLSAICALGAIIFPFYMLWTGFRDNSL